MSIPKFIEKAIEGGWRNNIIKWSIQKPGETFLSLTPGPYQEMEDAIINHFPTYKIVAGEEVYARPQVAAVLLDPVAWQSVGKVEGWFKGIAPEHEHLYWKAHWHGMIDALAEGKSLEDYIGTL